MQRRWEIDALRGLMLVLMTLTHLPTRLTNPFGQPFGYVSAAEGFVLLSGYMAGLVYGRLAVEKGIDTMRRAFWRRALLVYACHAALLLFLFTVIALIGIRVDEPAVKNLMSYYLQHPRAALAGGLLLIYQPPLLDILPMYVVFMLLSPLAFPLALQAGWGLVLASSAMLWLLAQFGVAHWLYQVGAAITHMPVPYAEAGAFNSFAWQLIWIVGLWLGASRHQPSPPSLRLPASVIALAAVVATVGLAWRHGVGQAPFGANEALNLWFDKWQLGPLRLLNLAALTVLLLRFGPWLAAHLPRMRVLETLGSASLAVFCAHLVVVLLVLSLFGAELRRPWSVDLPLLAIALASLYAAGRLTLWFERRPPREPGPRGFRAWPRRKLP
ncbi:OpgC domain-containing protein [Ramlibacter sp. AW1]|uniref:OpgC domain-containing protein n=1 Tax=Ramlibacter aurantiacus TaxID=2801330 RepID=A0A937D9B3_9BURK|nr:OpgC domain-containing protein [Ramlibacter aurantiacus]MBL0422976.1 OpgC domain-containing protein [Ramlibacter aurantiacus]